MHVFVDTYLMIHTIITGCSPRNSSSQVLVSGTCFTIRASIVLVNDVDTSAMRIATMEIGSCWTQAEA